MSNIEKPWCVVIKMDGMFAIRSFKTRREMREDYNQQKKFGIKCKKFRIIGENTFEPINTVYFGNVS